MDNSTQPDPAQKILWRGSHLGGILTLSHAVIFPSVIFFNVDVFDIHLSGCIDIITTDGAALSVEKAIAAIDTLYSHKVLGDYEELRAGGMVPS